MSTITICRQILSLALCLIVVGGMPAAQAADAEQIVLPFDCEIVGGHVQVRPSGDQAYRVYGARRQERYRACSEQNPDRCRTFLIHSFKMACGRDTVEWPDVYAAIAKATDGRAFYSNDGRLYYRMGPREPRVGYPFPEAPRATGIVEMPPGFAPIAGVDAIFTPLDSRVAALDDDAAGDARAYRDLPPPASRTPDSARQPTFAPALTPKEQKPKAADSPRAAEALKTAPLPKPEVVLEPKPLETASTANSAPPAPPAAAATPPPLAPVPDAAAPLTPTILNNPAAKEVEAASKTETIVAAAEVTPPTASQHMLPEGGPRVEGWSATGGVRVSVPPLAIAVLIAAATLAILFVILKRQAAAPIAAGPLRVPVEPTLPGFDPPRAGTGQAMTVRVMPDPPILANATLSNAAPARDLPASRADALALLGLNAEATDAVIRKLVEALRQSWHPDHATGDADRAAREERIKAINVAADILLRKTAA